MRADDQFQTSANGQTYWGFVAVLAALSELREFWRAAFVGLNMAMIALFLYVTLAPIGGNVVETRSVAAPTFRPSSSA